MAIAAFVLGIVGLVFSFVFLGVFPAIVGLILAAVSLRKEKSGFAIAGLVCSIIAILIGLVVFIGTPSTKETKLSGTLSYTDDGGGISAEGDADLASQMDIKAYSYYEEYFGRRICFVVTNNSDRDVRIGMNVTAKDSAGNALASTSPSESPVGPGQTAILDGWLDDVDMTAAIDYTMDVSTDVSRESAKDIDLKYNKNANNLVITATNNGSKAAKFLEVEVIFLKGGRAVGYDSTYVTDDDSELKAGTTRTGSVSLYSDKGFDDVIVGYSAYY